MSNDIIPHADAIIGLIEQARRNALQSVNAELIKLYWNVGEYLSSECTKSSWGDSFIDETAKYIKKTVRASRDLPGVGCIGCAISLCVKEKYSTRELSVSLRVIQ